jgi:hypothetical protein
MPVAASRSARASAGTLGLDHRQGAAVAVAQDIVGEGTVRQVIFVADADAVVETPAGIA